MGKSSIVSSAGSSISFAIMERYSMQRDVHKLNDVGRWHDD